MAILFDTVGSLKSTSAETPLEPIPPRAYLIPLPDEPMLPYAP